MDQDRGTISQSTLAQVAKILAGKHNIQTRLIKSSDIDDRISLMIEEIIAGKKNADIRRVAAEVLAKKTAEGKWNVREKDWQGEAAAFYDYVREVVRYTRDVAGVELFQSPLRTLQEGIGDCDDLTMLLAALLQSVGHNVRLRVIGLKDSKVYQHVYLIVGLPPHAPAKWFPLDPSRPEGPGWELPESQRGLIMDYEVIDDPDEEE